MTKPKEIPGKTYSHRRKWTPAEDLRLSVAYPDTPTAELAAEFNCKPSQIHDHALKLGVRKSKAFMTEFFRECAKRAGAGSIASSQASSRGTRACTSSPASDPQKPGSSPKTSRTP